MHNPALNCIYLIYFVKTDTKRLHRKQLFTLLTERYVPKIFFPPPLISFSLSCFTFFLQIFDSMETKGTQLLRRLNDALAN